MKKNIFLVVSIVLNLLFASYIFFFSPKVNTSYIKIQNVVDGDTFITEDGTRMRLSNIEAPELLNCGGDDAKNRLEEMIEGESVTITSSGEDVYNRTIALVYIDGVLVNNVLLAEGLVRYDGSPSKERDRLRESYQKAAKEKLGIFGEPCRSEKPDKMGCTIKGNIERGKGTKTYQLSGCPAYAQTKVEKDLGEGWFCTEKEARNAGYMKSTGCKN